jgi:hypothetical protein
VIEKKKKSGDVKESFGRVDSLIVIKLVSLSAYKFLLSLGKMLHRTKRAGSERASETESYIRDTLMKLQEYLPRNEGFSNIGSMRSEMFCFHDRLGW